MIKWLILIPATYLFTVSASSQKKMIPWNGKKCALVITYDDAIDEHLDHATPVLDSLDLKATFYLTAYSSSIRSRLEEWRKLASKGHELGNHTLYHPCNGGVGRTWIKPEYDLTKYTITRMVDEIRMTNVFLRALDGNSKRTFAYTCGDMKIGETRFINELKNEFIAARAVRNEMHLIGEVDLYNVDCFMVNNHSFAEMKGWVDEAISSQSLLVLLFHGVGGGNSLDVDMEDHKKLLEYVHSRKEDIYIAPMIEIAEHIREYQSQQK